MTGEDADPEAEGTTIARHLERLARLIRAEEHGAELYPAQWEALRFLARANRFSNSPSAVTAWLGATKGTVSQTLAALASKGYLGKSERPEEKRSIALTLTDKARTALAGDPLRSLARSAAALGGKTRRRMLKGLDELLAARSAVRVASCDGCRFFREAGRKDDPRGPHLCMRFEQPLAKAETGLLCAYGEART